MTKTQATGWEGILDAGEQILWQGRPDQGLHIKPAHIVMFVFGVFFAGFALFWMIMAHSAGGYFWMFGLIHFSVGLGIMVGGPVLDVITRRASHYTLTDRRAFLATDMPILGRRLNSYPITPQTTVTYDEGALSSVFFATREVRTKNGRRSVPVGFERIAEGRKVLALIRQVQRPTLAEQNSEQRPMP